MFLLIPTSRNRMKKAFLDRAPRAEPIITACESCDTMMTWRQIGDVPKYCDNCYHRLKGVERSTLPKWDRNCVPEEGTFLERIDHVVHYSPSNDKWYLKEPDRWVKCHRIEAA